MITIKLTIKEAEWLKGYTQDCIWTSEDNEGEYDRKKRESIWKKLDKEKVKDVL
jgi:hypothetical protein